MITLGADNWQFHLGATEPLPKPGHFGSFDIGGSVADNIHMFISAAFHLKLPNAGTEVAGN